MSSASKNALAVAAIDVVSVAAIATPLVPPGHVRPYTSRPPFPTRRVRLAAVGAEADDLDPMLGRDEAVLLRGRGDPVVEPALLHLDHAVASFAEQVVVMCVPAQPVALLAAVVREHVDDALLAQQRQRAIDGGETGMRVAFPQAAPELLGRHVVALARELPEHLQ